MHHFQLTSLQPKPSRSRRPAAISCSFRRCLSATMWLVCIVHLWWEGGGGLLPVSRYGGPPWRLIGLLFLRLRSQSDNCFSERLFETATPRNPRRIDNTRPPLSVFWRAEQFDAVTGAVNMVSSSQVLPCSDCRRCLRRRGRHLQTTTC